jgi:hypothetical protein
VKLPVRRAETRSTRPREAPQQVENEAKITLARIGSAGQRTPHAASDIDQPQSLELGDALELDDPEMTSAGGKACGQLELHAGAASNRLSLATIESAHC